jgi:hypothetical protein
MPAILQIARNPDVSLWLLFSLVKSIKRVLIEIRTNWEQWSGYKHEMERVKHLAEKAQECTSLDD